MPPMDRAPRHLRAAILLCIALALAPIGASAQTAPAATDESRREATALVQAINLVDQQRDMVDAMRTQFIRTLARASGKTEAAAAATVDEILLPEFRARMPELTNAVTEVYATLFSAEDLRGLRVFYASPLGQTLLRQQVALGRLTFELGSVWGQRVSAEAMAKHADTLRKRGFKL